MSLRTFHLIFILLVIMGAEMFVGWAAHDYWEARDPLILTLGIMSGLGGLGLAGYALYLVKRFDRDHIA
jgi:hypothetical protein